jgi:site-specific recombinase XerD
MSATLGRHLEVHMSDYSRHEEWLAKLRNHMETERYAATTMSRCMCTAGHFLVSLAKQHVELVDACPLHIEHYLRQVRQTYRRRHGHSPGYESWRRLQTDGIHMLLRLVQGRWPPIPVAVTPAEILEKEVCEAYSEWLTSVCGRSWGTVSGRVGEARRFLNWLGAQTRETLATLARVDVEDYMKDRAHLLCRSSLRRVAGDMRGFLWWLHMTERTVHDLSSTVIAPSVYAFEGLPSAVGAEDVKKIIAVTQKDCTPKGIRDYAILMLLSTYGVRAGEITMLRLDDVDWRNEIIRIRHNKTGATSYLPLLPEVGEAMLQYLQKSRPKTAFREVFIRCCAPYRPFKGGSNLGRLVRRWFEDAGVKTKGKHGPHAFRHARAVGMLRAAVPLKEIGDLLGHRSADSTLVYLKLAIEDLRAVAMEIPTEVRA